jgi:PAS domain S-box-containing protein
MDVADGPLTMVTIVDVTERERMRAELLEKMGLLELLFDSSPVGILLYEAAGPCVFANPAAARIVGAPASELMKLNFHAIPSWARSGLLQLAELALRTGTPERQSIQMVTTFGREVILDCLVSPVTSQGRPHLLLLVHDETARVRAVEALRESEIRFRSIVEATPDAIFLTDAADGMVVDANPAACALLGRSLGEIVGRHHTWVHAPSSRSEGVRRFAGQTADPSARPARQPLEFVFLRADGSEVPVEGASTPIVLGGRRLRMGVFRDVTARKAAEAELRLHRERLEDLVGERTAELQESNRRLQVEIERRREMEAEVIRAQKFESLGILAGGIAHDFNNALTVIANNILIAKREIAPGDFAHERLEAAAAASLRARSLTQQLLTFSLGGRPVKRCLHLGPIIRRAAEFSLRGARSRCDFELDPELLPAEVDEGQLEQVLGNLVINADQAMAEGGLVRITAANALVEEVAGLELPPGDYVRITVADDGHGIAAEHLTRIFDPYFTTKAKGSGLGLATTYSIVKNHGGLVTVRSQPEQGATFSVFLPVSKATPVDEAPPEPSLTRHAGRRILVMDDDADILEIVKLEADARGYAIATAADGAEAVRLFSRATADGARFDAVVLDLTVPGGMGGREAYNHLRTIDPEVRVILASGYSADSLLADAHTLGIARVVPKPYELRQLFAAIEDIC